MRLHTNRDRPERLVRGQTGQIQRGQARSAFPGRQRKNALSKHSLFNRERGQQATNLISHTGRFLNDDFDHLVTVARQPLQNLVSEHTQNALSNAIRIAFARAREVVGGDLDVLERRARVDDRQRDCVGQRRLRPGEINVHVLKRPCAS